MQWVVLAVVTPLAWVFMGYVLDTAVWQSCLVFLGVGIAGLALVAYWARSVGDPHLVKLGFAFLVKLVLVLVILRLGWMSSLQPAEGKIYVYDPQRYYHQAMQFADAGFDPEKVPMISYVGVLYYYGTIFKFIGFNPVAPALLNTLLNLFAALVVVRVGYLIKRERDSRDWVLGLGILLPDVLWFDCLTSRDGPALALVTIATLSATGYLIRRPEDRYPLWLAVLSVPALVLVGIVRTSMVVPSVAAIAIVFLVSRTSGRVRLAGAVLVAAAAVVLIKAPEYSSALGSIRFEYEETFARATGAYVDQLDEAQWSARSVSKLLVPTSVGQAVLFAPARLIMYIVAPLPNVTTSLGGLAAGDWQAFQGLAHCLTALINVLLFPLAFAALLRVRGIDRLGPGWAFQVPFWCVFAAVAVGVPILHERYRVMASLLLWACIWLGFTTDRRAIRLAYGTWLGFGALGVSFWVFYKLLT